MHHSLFRRLTPSLLPAAIVVPLLAGCGSDGDSGTEPDGQASSSMSAVIDGDPFSASTVGQAQADQGTLSFVGTTATDVSPVTQVSIHVEGVTGTGTYSLGDADFPTNLALVTVTAGATPSQWSTRVLPGSGSVTVTTLTTTRVVGTFQFTAGPDAGTAATGSVSVTAGAFDLRL